MSAYRIYKTVDILGEEEFLVFPEPDYNFNWEEIPDDMPVWFDSPNGWDWMDFANPEIYQSVEVIVVHF